MATYSSIHAWKIPRTEETGRLQPMELQKSRTPLVTIQQQYSFVKMGEHFQFSLVAQSCPNLCDPRTAARQASLSITNSQSLLELMSIMSISDAIQPSHPLLSQNSSFSLSQHQGFYSESALCIRWPKYWNFSFCIIPSNEYSGLND